MKLMGHVYVATKSFPEKNQELLSFGSALPETVFYTKNPALSFDQIHEGGLELYKYCKKYFPDMCDLAIGCMTHSVKYGADIFNSLESMKIIGYQEDDIIKISDALMIDIETSYSRVHNLYDLVLDYFINENYPNIKDIINKTKEIDKDKDKVSHVLSTCFKVSENSVKENITHLWDKYDISLVDSFEGLAQLWKILASDLKDKDPINIEKTSKLLSYFYDKAKPSANNFLDTIVSSTRFRVNQAIIQ